MRNKQNNIKLSKRKKKGKHLSLRRSQKITFQNSIKTDPSSFIIYMHIIK